MSGATPGGRALLQCNIPGRLTGEKLKLYIEANASFDFNDYYRQDIKAGEEGYSDVNGQPSMLWMAELDPSQVIGETAFHLVGAGEVMGDDHAVHDDLGHVSTGKELLWDIIVKYDFANGSM